VTVHLRAKLGRNMNRQNTQTMGNTSANGPRPHSYSSSSTRPSAGVEAGVAIGLPQLGHKQHTQNEKREEKRDRTEKGCECATSTVTAPYTPRWTAGGGTGLSESCGAGVGPEQLVYSSSSSALPMSSSSSPSWSSSPAGESCSASWPSSSSLWSIFCPASSFFLLSYTFFSAS